MQVLAYCFNSLKPQTQIIKEVNSLFFWENKECNHPITKDNILKCLDYSNQPLRLDSKNKLIRSNERCFLDEFVDFIHVSY
jgi:hypothetical protein